MAGDRPRLLLETAGGAIELLRVEAGRFAMGSPNAGYCEAPPHTVTVARPFYMGRLPVTQRQWAGVTGDNPSRFQFSGDHPVDNVSWLDAARFCQRLSDLAGRTVRLPSEAEWEYCCRAGSRGEFFFSEEGPFADDTEVRARIRRELREYAWFDDNSRESTHEAGRKRANGWGFADMTGNVWEWCADHWHDSYAEAPPDGGAWVEGPGARPLRCLRGGAWDMNAFRCRSCYRSWDWEHLAADRFGLRICAE